MDMNNFNKLVARIKNFTLSCAIEKCLSQIEANFFKVKFDLFIFELRYFFFYIRERLFPILLFVGR